LNRQLSLPVSTMSQWWVSRSSNAVVKAIELLLNAMRENPPGLPATAPRPRLTLPSLPLKR
jgi:hypothetical protein